MRTKLDTKASPLRIGVPAMAVILGSFLSGAMTSLSAFAIPVLLDTNINNEQMLRQWIRLYHYGHTYMPALCIATFGFYGYASLSRRASTHKQWYRYGVAATSTISMVPFTWLVMAGTNDVLFRM